MTKPDCEHLTIGRYFGRLTCSVCGTEVVWDQGIWQDKARFLAEQREKLDKAND